MRCAVGRGRYRHRGRSQCVQFHLPGHWLGRCLCTGRKDALRGFSGLSGSATFLRCSRIAGLAVAVLAWFAIAFAAVAAITVAAAALTALFTLSLALAFTTVFARLALGTISASFAMLGLRLGCRAVV